jgi:hypothetical protein
MLFGVENTSWKPVSVSKIGNGNWFPFPLVQNRKRKPVSVSETQCFSKIGHGNWFPFPRSKTKKRKHIMTSILHVRIQLKVAG